jgi:hypothetical protein
MILAMLFDWSAYPSEDNYWHAVRDAVFGTGIVQRSGRHMKLAVGDVLTGLRAGQNAEALFDAAFNNSEWHLADEDRLNGGFPTIFGMVFENMPRALAAELHDGLSSHHGYLGIFSVHFEFGPHLALYRLRLPPEYRLEGTKLRKFYSMGNQDGCDPDDLEDMRRFGYDDVAFEDTGASRTIFDDYDTPRHFKRVATFRDLLTHALAGGEDDAYQLTMLLEDLSPKLFNALGAAAERLVEAENEEEVAQAALSGRRYMEQLADALFPPTGVKRGNRELTRDKYKNRLWAFVEDQIPNDKIRVRVIGKEIDRVVEELNAGLHADRAKERVASSFTDAATLTATLFALAPDPPRNGYLAYTNNLRSFVRDLALEHDGGRTKRDR